MLLEMSKGINNLSLSVERFSAGLLVRKCTLTMGFFILGGI